MVFARSSTGLAMITLLLVVDDGLMLAFVLMMISMHSGSRSFGKFHETVTVVLLQKIKTSCMKCTISDCLCCVKSLP